MPALAVDALKAAGEVRVSGPAVTTDGAVSNSAPVTLRGFFDSDATTAVLSTKRDFTIRNTVTSGTAYRLSVLNDAGTEVLSVDQAGVLGAASVPWALVTGTPTTLAGYGITDAASATHTHAADDLSDVVVTTPAEGHVLTWDATNSRWRNVANSVDTAANFDWTGQHTWAKHLGINAAPHAGWAATNYKALDFGGGRSSVMGTTTTGNLLALTSGAYQSGTDWLYSLNSNAAAQIYFQDGEIYARTAPTASGTGAGTAAPFATRLRINNAGNLGIGTPDIKAWNNNLTVMQGAWGALAFHKTAPYTHLTANAWVDGPGTWNYQGTGYASRIAQENGTILCQVAPSGTADTAITWTTALQIDNAGITYTRHHRPDADNAYDLGSSAIRWSAVWAVNGTIQTSTGAEKELGAEVTAAEALEAIRATPVRRFTYAADPGYEYTITKRGKQLKGKRKHQHVGVVLEDLPEWMRTTDTGLNPMSLAGLALAGVRAVDEELTALKARVAALEAA